MKRDPDILKCAERWRREYVELMPPDMLSVLLRRSSCLIQIFYFWYAIHEFSVQQWIIMDEAQRSKLAMNWFVQEFPDLLPGMTLAQLESFTKLTTQGISHVIKPGTKVYAPVIPSKRFTEVTTFRIFLNQYKNCLLYTSDAADE